MKNKLFLVLFLLATSYSFGQIDFEENLVIDNSLFVTSISSTWVADIDGDGDDDILTVSLSNDDLTILENRDGLGKDYVKRTAVSNIDSPSKLHAGDVDNDGDLDIVIVSTNNKVIWLENTDGRGSYTEKQSIYAYDVDFVRIVDIDNDGDRDIVWSSYGDGEIRYFRNTDGLGDFSTLGITIEPNVYRASDFHTTDLDGDSDIDVISSYSTFSGDRYLTWYENENGTGSFSSRIVISDDAYSGNVADIDGDGDMDVVAISLSEDHIVWFENLDGAGNFDTAKTISTNPDGVYSFQLVDVDGDNDIDVISITNDQDKIVWHENTNGLGSFATEQLIKAEERPIRSFLISDVDKDGDQDFVTHHNTITTLKWFENTNGQGNFTPYLITKYFSGGRATFAADLDGDGDNDILTASHWDDKIAWYENKDGLGDFRDTQRIISDDVNGASSVWAEDLDKDGDNDILVTSSLDDYVGWFENLDGQGNFGELQYIDNDVYNAQKVYTVDIDNDGDKDIFCHARGNISWYENLDGLGNFGSEQSVDAINNFFIHAIDFGDLDGDNDLDIAAATNLGVLYYENLNGQGSFSPRQEVDLSVDGIAIKIVDIDNDGDKDLVSANENSQTADNITWYENTDGAATFGSAREITTLAVNPEDISVMDVDSDGDPDIISASRNGGMIAWYENTDGLGDFSNTQQIISTSAFDPEGFTEADVNGDNTMDLIFISDLNGILSWFDNKGFTPSNEIKGAIRFDLIGDGCSDQDDLLSGIMLVSTGNASTYATFSQSDGKFKIFPTEDGIINTQVTSQLPNYYQASPVNFQSNFTGFDNTDEINFCIEPIGSINDLEISIYPPFNDPRPGFDTTYKIVYKNRGTTQLSGTVTFEFDGTKLQFLSASETVSSQTANTVTFNYTDINPFETRTIDLELNVMPPPTTNIDEVLVSTATITPITGDETEENNTFVLRQTVVGSYDPNDIRVLEGDEILFEDIDNYLHYIIRFQNTGTASAINVLVKHTLDGKLDWSTIQLESLSHDGRVAITNGNNIEFIFDNINLPDSTNDEPNSHGYITFKIKPKSNLVVGDIVSGVADIFFDFNLPITTNTVHTEVVDDALSTTLYEGTSFRVFPNPAHSELTISGNNIIDTISIIDINGRVLKTLKGNNTEFNIDVSDFAQGVYFLNIQSRNAKQVVKFIKD